MTGAHQDALTMLKVARALGAQYHRMRGNREFKLGPFIPPPASDSAQVVDATQSFRVPNKQAGSLNYRYAKGVRPQKGRNLAIGEWPTAAGPADYVLFIGLMPIAIVEAKRKNKNVKSAIEQAKPYSKGIKLAEASEAFSKGLVSPGGPWQDYQVPFLFSTNGRAYLRQLLEFSGIWFLDARLPTNHPRALEGWCTPDGLMALSQKDIAQATQTLETEELDYLGFRPYQNEAIKAVEAHLAQGQQHILLAMATGTGKTRIAIGLIYRLLKAKRFNRILFLVDRTSLGEQAHNAFKDVKMESLQTFTDVYEVKGLGDLTPEVTTKVHLSTVQAMVRRCIYTEDGMTWKVGEPMQVYHVKRQTVDLVNAPDEVKMELESFNKRVVTENFNRVVCHELARQIDPTLPGKTLIFCATDVHADMDVRLLTDEMEELYGGVNDKVIREITGAADKPAVLIRRYKNEHYLSVAATVDLLQAARRYEVHRPRRFQNCESCILETSAQSYLVRADAGACHSLVSGHRQRRLSHLRCRATLRSHARLHRHETGGGQPHRQLRAVGQGVG